MVAQRPMRFGWSRFDNDPAPDLAGRSGRTQAAASQPLSASCESAPSLDGRIVSRLSGLALPNDKTITISLIAGPTKGLIHRLAKPRISIGHTGGGADIEIDDPKVSGLHCVVGVTQDRIRLCDLDSANGTYINDERVQAADLEHLSEFRVGSSLLLVTILPKREMCRE